MSERLTKKGLQAEVLLAKPNMRLLNNPEYYIKLAKYEDLEEKHYMTVERAFEILEILRVRRVDIGDFIVCNIANDEGDEARLNYNNTYRPPFRLGQEEFDKIKEWLKYE